MQTTRDFSQTIISVYGEAGVAWLKALPELRRACEERWDMRIGPPFALSYNYVAPVTLAGGTEAVIKLGPGIAELAHEINALRHFDGRGIVRLLDADPARGVMLLERASPGTPLAELGDDESMTDAAADVMLQLWRPPPSAHSFTTVEDLAAGLRKLRNLFGGGTGPLPADLVEAAESHFRDLLLSTTDPVLLHGDLHHWNIVRAGRQPWLAIDPKGVVGERGYEAGAFLRNHLLHLPDPKRALAPRVDQLSERLELDREWLIAWGIAHNMLSAWWSVEDHGSGWEAAVSVAQMLKDLERSSR
ncbi:MAG: aminoglycoside phosphotransferase family protein [Chloroflexota bacterium]|nr:aminoglycoside phosphotransferase family protein [Chloroflexota bacterium]